MRTGQLAGKTMGICKILKYEGKRKYLCECVRCRRIHIRSYAVMYNNRGICCSNECMSEMYDYTGQKFGHWIAIEVVPKKMKHEKHKIWKVRCNCGLETGMESHVLKVKRPQAMRAICRAKEIYGR